MIRWFIAAALALLAFGYLLVAHESVAGQTRTTIPAELVALEKSLNTQSGDVRIPEANAIMHLGDEFYFLPAADAKRVIVEAWGNPADQADNVLGLVFKKGATIFDNVWGAVVTFEDTGYVSDKDAQSEDYGAVLEALQQGAAATNKQRKASGFPTVEVLGWAQPPTYNPVSKSLIWARELSFGGEPVHSLNYDVRLLGRTGVLSLNMVSAMPEIGGVRTAATALGDAVTFEPGSTYADYNPAIDKAAGYGLAGLVAGGAGVAAAKKLGILAIVLGFGKKFIIVILAGVVALGGALMQRFRGHKSKDEEIYPEYADTQEASDEKSI